jgi:HNH endonuclease
MTPEQFSQLITALRQINTNIWLVALMLFLLLIFKKMLKVGIARIKIRDGIVDGTISGTQPVSRGRQLRLDLCSYCGKPAENIDHVVPRSKGGKGRNNKAPSCERCNREKSDKHLLVFLLERRCCS